MIFILLSLCKQFVSKFDEIRLFFFKRMDNSSWQTVTIPAILRVLVYPTEKICFLLGSTCEGKKNAHGPACLDSIPFFYHFQGCQPAKPLGHPILSN